MCNRENALKVCIYFNICLFFSKIDCLLFFQKATTPFRQRPQIRDPISRNKKNLGTRFVSNVIFDSFYLVNSFKSQSLKYTLLFEFNFEIEDKYMALGYLSVIGYIKLLFLSCMLLIDIGHEFGSTYITKKIRANESHLIMKRIVFARFAKSYFV